MSDRDPIEFLSHAGDRRVEPDPEFAAGLLDHLLRDLAEDHPNDAVPFPDISADEFDLVPELTPVAEIVPPRRRWSGGARPRSPHSAAQRGPPWSGR